MRYFLGVFLIAGLIIDLRGQIVGDMDDETRLYAQTKQVNQFFRRFNGEEDEKGERYYPSDKQYRSAKLRRKYLGVLFDSGSPGITGDLRNQFSRDVLDKSETGLLDFHAPGWFSEVQSTFTVNGRDQGVTLFMELEKSHLGYKWVISKVHLPWLSAYLARDTTRVGQFLHPMSHELDFMNLRKAFDQRDSVSQFAARRHVVDQLSIFLYEIKRGNMKFKSVESVKFHFFQIDGWYFEVADFNRPGYNTGWLISNLVKINNPSDKELLRKHVLYESK